MASSVRLDIPARSQWYHGHGYCGETVVQSFGLYNGAWISQQLVRDVNGGEYLIHHVTPEDDLQRRPQGGGGGGDPLATLTTLKFSYKAWDYENAPQPQFSAYCLWIKKCLLQGFPIMFRTKFNEFFAGHIMPIIGIDYSNENIYDERDIVHYYSLFGKEVIKQPFSELGNDPAKIRICCRWGCIPLDVCWGITITGILDEDMVCLPVRLTVNDWDEPCEMYGMKAIDMIGRVTVQELTIGRRYSLLRYSSYVDVPVSGDATAFLTSNYTSKHEFTAENNIYVYEDPIKINSNGSTYYRCVANPLET